MNQEIKKRLEQAADKRYHPASDHREHYVAGAQTILENPSEWGLVKAQWKEDAIHNADTGVEIAAERDKYREALERIAAIAVDYQPSIQTEAALTIAKESLKIMSNENSD